MNKKVIIAGLLGGISFFLLGFLFYGILLADLFKEMSGSAINVEKQVMDFVSLFLGQLAWGVFLAFLFEYWSKTKSAAGGFKTGTLVGLFTGLGMNLTTYATTNMMTLEGALFDVMVWTGICGLSGVVIGTLLGKVK